jgi:tetrapyrrole methylase family protein/MazG family protein
VINLVGLGPGGTKQLTLEAMEALDASDVVFVRGGAHHPVPTELAARGKNVVLLGALYHVGMRHAEMYELVADIVLTAARLYPRTTYAVPGNIFVFETACRLIKTRADAAGIDVRLVPGLSSTETLVALLGIEPAEGLAVLQGMNLAEHHSPRLQTLVLQAWDKLDDRGVARLQATLLAQLPPEHAITIVANAGFEGGGFRRVDGTVADLERLAAGIDPDWATCYIPARAP